MDPTVYLELFFSAEGGFSVYYNPEFDKVVAEAKATLNDAKRGELIKKATRMVHEDVASIPICNAVVVYATKKDIDFRPTQKHAMELVLIKDVDIK